MTDISFEPQVVGVLDAIPSNDLKLGGGRGGLQRWRFLQVCTSEPCGCYHWFQKSNSLFGSHL